MSDVPALFVDWSAVEGLLRQAIDGGGLAGGSAGVGVQSCVLMQADGSLLCVAGPLASARLLSALGSTVYAAYAEGGDNAWGEKGLDCVSLHCEKGVVAVAQLSRFLLCLQADHSVQVGQLMQAMQTLLQQMEPLKGVYPQG
jgi:hypothetical protein